MSENGTHNVMPTVVNTQSGTVTVKTEETTPTDVPDKATLLAVLQFLKKRNFKDTEEILRKESKFFDEKLDNSSASDSDVSNVLSVYKSEGDPDIYENAFTSLKKFVESSLDVYRHELSMIFYPVFVRMYLELVFNSHEQQAIKFMEKFRWEQEEYYQEDVNRLSSITKQGHMKGNELMDNFMASHFTVRMSRDTYTFLKRHLQEKKETILLNIIQEHLYLDVYEGVPRNKQEVDATAGAMMGEATRQANKTKVYYGLLKETGFHIAVEEEEEEESAEVESGDKPKKKKIKKDSLLSKKAKNDPNAPPNNRVPLPELKDADKVIKGYALRESAKRIKLGPEQLPSICFYTFLNSQNHVTSSEICEDSTLLSAGLADATIRVWSVIPSKLKTMKSSQDLSGIDREAGDVLVRMMDDRLARESRVLLGHSGPVYSTSFSYDKNFMISCSADATIRLWSLQTWSNLVCYKGHMYPVWDVKFCRHGYYFASCGFDRTARLWATEYHQPLRVFTGHVSDVDCVQFHPNSNYLATGSDDRSVRLWDLSTGTCVRHMTGHKGSVHNVAFSNDGRFLASAGADKRIMIWDIAHGRLLTDLKGHTDTIYSLSFSRDDNILASGGVDGMVKLWDASKMFEDIDVEDLNISHVPTIRSNTDALMLGSYPTKSTTVLHLHFTRKNLLLASGMFVEN